MSHLIHSPQIMLLVSPTFWRLLSGCINGRIFERVEKSAETVSVYQIDWPFLSHGRRRFSFVFILFFVSAWHSPPTVGQAIWSGQRVVCACVFIPVQFATWRSCYRSASNFTRQTNEVRNLCNHLYVGNTEANKQKLRVSETVNLRYRRHNIAHVMP